MADIDLMVIIKIIEIIVIAGGVLTYLRRMYRGESMAKYIDALIGETQEGSDKE